MLPKVYFLDLDGNQMYDDPDPEPEGSVCGLNYFEDDDSEASLDCTD